MPHISPTLYSPFIPPVNPFPSSIPQLTRFIADSAREDANVALNRPPAPILPLCRTLAEMWAVGAKIEKIYGRASAPGRGSSPARYPCRYGVGSARAIRFASIAACYPSANNLRYGSAKIANSGRLDYSPASGSEGSLLHLVYTWL